MRKNKVKIEENSSGVFLHHLNSEKVSKYVRNDNGNLLSNRGNPLIEKSLHQTFVNNPGDITDPALKCNHDNCNNIKHYHNYYECVDTGNTLVSCRCNCYDHYYDTLPYDEYCKENIQILRFIQSGNPEILLKDMLTGDVLEDVEITTLFGDDTWSYYELHHQVFEYSTSCTKSNTEPSNYILKTRIVKNVKVIEEFLGIVSLSANSHRYIHKKYNSMYWQDIPEDFKNWAIKTKDNFQLFKKVLMRKFNVELDLEYSKVISNLEQYGKS